MAEEEVSRSPPAPAPDERYKQLLVIVVAILGTLLLGFIAGRFEVVALPRTITELIALVKFAFVGYLVGLIVNLPFVAVPPGKPIPPLSRIVWSPCIALVLFAFLGIKVGVSYTHLCAAGSRLIEWSAILGTPVVAGGAAGFFVRRRRPALGVLLALAVLATVWVLHRPYLARAHGEPVTWF